MQRFFIVLSGVLLIAVCAACAPRSGGSPSDKAASDEWRLQNLEARFLEYKEDRQASQAELQDSIDRLNKKLSAIEKQLEKTDAENAALTAEAAALREALRAKTQMSAALAAEPLAGSSGRSDSTEKSAMAAAPNTSVAPKTTPVATVNGNTSAKASGETGGKTAASKPADRDVKRSAASNSATAQSSPETRMYENGLNMVRSGNVEEGRNILDAFLGEFPASPLVPNALYWLGETYYHEKRYAQAILTFKDVIRRFPKHNKAAASMLKIGFSYNQLGDKSNARFYLQALVDDYPTSEPARMARTRLQSL